MSRKRHKPSPMASALSPIDDRSRKVEVDAVLRLAAGFVVIEGERPVEFADFRARLEQHLRTDDPIAIFLIGHLATLLWRLRRSAAFEAGLLTWIAYQQATAHDRTGLRIGAHFFSGDARGLPRSGQQSVQAPEVRRRTGRMLEAALRKADLLGRLGRYEAHLMRQAERTIAELRRLGVDMHVHPADRAGVAERQNGKHHRL